MTQNITKSVIYMFSAFLTALPVPTFGQDKVTTPDLVFLAKHAGNTEDARGVYLINVGSKSCRKISVNSIGNGELKYNVGNDVGTMDFVSGKVSHISEPKIDKIIHSREWRLAQRCPSVKKIFEPKEIKFSLDRVLKTPDKNIPMIFVTRMDSGTCNKMGIYDNCETNCVQYLKPGAEVFMFVITKEVAEDFSKYIGVDATCE